MVTPSAENCAASGARTDAGATGRVGFAPEADAGSMLTPSAHTPSTTAAYRGPRRNMSLIRTPFRGTANAVPMGSLARTFIEGYRLRARCGTAKSNGCPRPSARLQRPARQRGGSAGLVARPPGVRGGMARWRNAPALLRLADGGMVGCEDPLVDR